MTEKVDSVSALPPMFVHADKQYPRIVFMGTPDFAVASLRALVEEGYNIVGVITAPDKPGGRGLHLQPSAVKKYALLVGLPVLQPEKLKAQEFLNTLRLLHADLQVVVAFRMLPEVVWAMPPMGTVNVHGSLLPQYRGAAPINWAIIQGERETGVTTFKLKQDIDTGNILLQQRLPIGDAETAGELHDKMMVAGAALLVQTVKGLTNGSLQEKPQEAQNDDAGPNPQLLLKHAPKIFTDTCKIDWNGTVADVYNLVRGLSPYPSAFTFLQDKKLKIFRAEKVVADTGLPPGTVSTDGKTYLQFAAKDGYLNITELQMEGKKRLLVQDFLRGFKR